MLLEQATRGAFGNPSSAHAEGRLARRTMDDARGRVAMAVHAQPDEIVFTSGGTESDNLAVIGAVQGAARPRAHVIVSQVEHHAVLQPCRALEAQGARVSYVGCDACGRVDPQAVASLLDDETVLVSIMHANNEVGTVQPVAEIARLAHAAGAILHCDAVQSLGRLPVNVDELGVDLLSLSGHKLGGPKGIGALFVRRGVRLAPMIRGGPQEDVRRAGTENVAGAAGMGLAAELAVSEQPAEVARLARLKSRLWHDLCTIYPEVAINGNLESTLANTLNVSFEGLQGEAITAALDREGIAVSTGAACATGDTKPSHVLEAMCLGGGRCHGAIRISMGPATGERDIAALCDALRRVLPALASRTWR